MSTNADKTMKLTLASPYKCVNLNNDMIEDPSDDCCVVRLAKLYMKMAFPPGYKGVFFLQEAPKKDLKLCRKDGLEHRGD
jgi:hypothetical protein